jgi:hypothetical protein
VLVRGLRNRLQRTVGGCHAPASGPVGQLTLRFFKAAPRAARAADTAGTAGLPLTLPPGCASTPVSWREGSCPFGAAARTGRTSPGRGGFDKGTLAAAHIGHLRAGQKPARSASKRTGRRPLSNPPLRPGGAYLLVIADALQQRGELAAGFLHVGVVGREDVEKVEQARPRLVALVA